MRKLLVAAFVALLMAGCGGDGKSGSDGSESNQTSAETTPVKPAAVAKIDLNASRTPDDFRPIDDVLKEVDELIRGFAQSPGTKNGSGNTQQSVASEVDSEAMVRGVAKAFAAKDFEAFRKFTCLGMGKDEFKQFMAKNDDRKVVRTWDPVRDDFQEELVVEMQKAYAEILQEAREKGFDWNQAKVVECEHDDDVKAKLRSGNVELYLHLDDCFMTPQGLLTFDAPRARARELAEPNRPAIGFSVMFLSNPYCEEMVAGMQAEADQRGAELLVEDTQFDAKKLSDQIDAFIAQKVKAIVLAPMGPAAVGPAIKRAMEANAAGQSALLEMMTIQERNFSRVSWVAGGH